MIDLAAMYRDRPSRAAAPQTRTNNITLPTAPSGQPGAHPSITGWTDTQKQALAAHIAALAHKAGRGARIEPPPPAQPEPSSSMTPMQFAEATLKKFGRWNVE